MNVMLHFAGGGNEWECGVLCVDGVSCTVSAVGGVSCTTVTSEGVSVSWTHGSGGLGVPPNGVVGDGTSCAKVNSGEGPSVESLESEDKIIVVARLYICSGGAGLALKFEF